jgi:hypothetical protein
MPTKVGIHAFYRNSKRVDGGPSPAMTVGPSLLTGQSHRMLA